MSKRDYQFLILLFLLFYVVLIVRNAWMSDDAYITFRTIENFLHGYGLGFNVNVRVQSYTHPLWMFLLAAVYFATDHLHLTFGNGIYFPAIFFSIFVSAAAVYLAMQKVVKPDLLPLGLFIAPVILSRAFIDFSTSGLENPLSYLLLVAFLWRYFDDEINFFQLALIASLIGLNRMDDLVLIGPALLYRFWLERPLWKKNLGASALGFLPFILWELFSLFYYGFLFPNTAYAKLNTGISPVLLAEQGFDYFLNSINWDPLTLFTIALAGILVFMERDKRSVPIYVGVLLYLIYVVKIGGDFMSGRFFTAPLLLSALLLSRVESFSSRYLMVGLGIIITLGVVSVRSTLLDPLLPTIGNDYYERIDHNQIADERLAYFDKDRNEGLAVLGFRDVIDTPPYAGDQWRFSGVSKLLVLTSLGKIGYVDGPDYYFVDKTALVDPLLARLPVHDPGVWRIGHFLRRLPEGYVETLKSGKMQIAEPHLAMYYQKLNFVIAGPLWNWNRVIEIWKFNTGQYDYLIRAYLRSAGR